MFCWCCEIWKRSLYLYKVNKRLLRMQVSIMQTQTEFIARNFIGLNSRQMPGWCHFLPIVTCQTQNIRQTGKMRRKFGLTEWLVLTIDMIIMTWYRVRGIILVLALAQDNYSPSNSRLRPGGCFSRSRWKPSIKHRGGGLLGRAGGGGGPGLC